MRELNKVQERPKCRKIAIKESRTKAVVDGAFPVRLAALSAVAQESGEKIIRIDQIGIVPGFLEASGARLG